MLKRRSHILKVEDKLKVFTLRYPAWLEARLNATVAAHDISKCSKSLPIKKELQAVPFFTEILSRMITSHHVRGYLLYNYLRRSDHINTGYDWKV